MNTAEFELSTCLRGEAHSLLNAIELELRTHKGLLHSAALLSTSLAQLQNASQWLPPSHNTFAAISKLSKVVPALLQQCQQKSVAAKLLHYCYGLQQTLSVDCVSQLHRWCLQEYLLWEQAERDIALQGGAFKSGGTGSGAMNGGIGCGVPQPQLQRIWHLGLWLQRLNNLRCPAELNPLSLPQLQQWRQQWQEALQGTAKSLIQHNIAARLDAIVLLSRSHTAVISMATIQALARECVCVAALLYWAADKKKQEEFAYLAQELLHSALQRQHGVVLVSNAWWQTWWLFRWQQKSVAVGALPTHDGQLIQAAQVDITKYQAVLRHCLQNSDSTAQELSKPLLHQHYHLPWILEALQLRSFVCVYYGWHHFLQLHWQNHVPLSKELGQLLQQSAALLCLAWEARSPAARLLPIQIRLLLLWPSLVASQVQSVTLDVAANKTNKIVELSQVPLLLAKKLHVLTAIQPSWFVSAEALALQQAALISELQFLERGAAAIRVYAVEKLSSLLLSVHHDLQAKPINSGFPSVLLWQAHQHLVALLDAAAAWQDTLLDEDLEAQLRCWRQVQTEELSTAPEYHAIALAGKVQQFVQQLAQTLELKVRFSLESPLPLQSAGEQACEVSLKAILHFILMEQAATLEQRRLQRKPAATTLAVNLQPCMKGIYITTLEDGTELVPSSKALQRLQRKLPRCVEGLCCESRPSIGRRFDFWVFDTPQR